jgi:membrane protein DedA with SNARE-associated domain
LAAVVAGTFLPAMADMDRVDAGFVAIDRIVDWLAAHTYAAVFVGTLIDASGLPFPGRLLLVAAGVLARSGGHSLVLIILLGAVAAMLMDHVWYVAGAWGSQRVLRLYRRLTGSSGGREDPAIDYFTRYGALTIVLGRFFTSVRAVAWPVAAANGVGYAKFLVLDLLGATLWTSVWVVLGSVAGEHWESAAATGGVWLTVAGAILMAIAAAPLAARLWRRRARRRAARQSDRPTASS